MRPQMLKHCQGINPKHSVTGCAGATQMDETRMLERTTMGLTSASADRALSQTYLQLSIPQRLGPGHVGLAALGRRMVCSSRLVAQAGSGTMHRDTGAVILRVLTARATQKLLMQLSELDIHVSSWLSNYVSEHKPLEGNKVRAP